MKDERGREGERERERERERWRDEREREREREKRERERERERDERDRKGQRTSPLVCTASSNATDSVSLTEYSDTVAPSFWYCCSLDMRSERLTSATGLTPTQVVILAQKAEEASRSALMPSRYCNDASFSVF